MSSKSGPLEQPTPPRPPVAVKGSRDGLRVVVLELDDPKALETSLKEQLERRGPSFFHGANAVLELPPGRLDMELVARLALVLDDAGMRLQQVTAKADEAEHPAERSSRDETAAVEEGSALVVERTLRSGQRVVHDGAVIVLGDVNPGAEVVAGGSVFVWGRLRGTVEAGLGGGKSVVCALDLAPTQLRIGPALARAPEEPGRTPVPEIARESEGHIVVDPWTSPARQAQ